MTRAKAEAREDCVAETIDDLGPGQFGQRAEGAVVPGRARHCPIERIDAGMAFGKNDEPEYLAMNPNGRVPTLVDGDYRAVGIQFHHALSLPRLWQGHADLSAGRRRGAPRSTAGSTGRCRRCSRSIARCSGGSCARRRTSATWSQMQKDADAEAEVWAIVDRQLSTRRFMEGDQFTSPTSRSAPTRGAGSASRASPGRRNRI